MAFGRTDEPATELQAARVDRGWTQAKTLFKLRQQAQDDGVGIAGSSSLKTMLSRWENGETVSPVYVGLFCKIYDASAEDLGLDSPGEKPVDRVSPVAPKLDRGAVDYFRSVFQQQLLADNWMGPHHLVEPVRAQADLLDGLIRGARGSVRNELLVLACRYHEFTGWLYQDAGDPRSAQTHTDRAMRYAAAIGDARETAYTLMRQSNIASDLGDADLGLDLTGSALRDQSRIPHQVRALILSQRARALAITGDADESARTMDGAFNAIDTWDGVPDELASYCNEPYLTMESAAVWSLLGRPERAIAIFEERNTTEWPATQRRDQGLFLARLANAHAANSDMDRACATGQQAIEIVSTATSARALRELHQLRSKLDVWRRADAVAELRSKIQQLVRPRTRKGPRG